MHIYKLPSKCLNLKATFKKKNMDDYKDMTDWVDRWNGIEQILYLYNFANEPRYGLQFHLGDVVIQSF